VHCCASLSIGLGAAAHPAASHTVTAIPMIARTMVVILRLEVSSAGPKEVLKGAI
jgi:hypothetical protein